MPKQIYNESDFSGGINGLDSPRDVSIGQVIEGKSISFDERGRIRLLGRAIKTDIAANLSDDIDNPGFDSGTSFFRFAYDYGMLDSSDAEFDAFDSSPDAGETGYLVLGNREHIAIWDSQAQYWFTIAIATGTDPTVGNRKMQFYFLNGALRAYNPTFHANSKPTWFGHVKRGLFKIEAGTATHDVSHWYKTTTKLLPPASTANQAYVETLGSESPGKWTALNNNTADVAQSVADNLIIHLDDQGSGNWIAGTYPIYLSYIYDDSQESQATKILDMAVAVDKALYLAVTVDYTAPSNISDNFNSRITGSRLYYSDPVDGDGIRYHLMDISFVEGCRKFNEKAYTAWKDDAGGTNHFECPPDIIGKDAVNETSSFFEFEDMPKVVTYEMLNGYGPTEETDIQFKCHTVLNNRLYVANIKESNGGTFPDRVVQTPINFTGVPQYDTFPIESGILDIAANDGDAVTALEGYGDRILVFKKKNVYVLNVANGGGYVETKLANMGVHSPHQVTATKHGIVWINSSGCYLYQEGQPINLLGDKIGTEARFITPSMKWDVREDKFPAIAYLPRVDKLLISVGLADGHSNDAWIFSFLKKSWSYGAGVIGDWQQERTNFAVDDHGDAYFAQNTDAVLEIYKWSDSAQSHNEFNILFKDFDGGQPNIRKKFYKAYLQFRCSDDTNVIATYGVNGNYSNKLVFDITQAGIKSGGELEQSSTQANIIATNANFMTQSNATIESITFSDASSEWNFGGSYGWYAMQSATGGRAFISNGSLIWRNDTDSDAVFFQPITVANTISYNMSFTNNNLGVALLDGTVVSSNVMMYISTSDGADNAAATTHADLIDGDFDKAFVVSGGGGKSSVSFTADADVVWYVCFRNVELTAGANPALFASWVTSSLAFPTGNVSGASIKREDEWTTAVLKPNTSSDGNNIYSTALRLDVKTAGSSNVPSDFEIDSISYVYRSKNIK